MTIDLLVQYKYFMLKYETNEGWKLTFDDIQRSLNIELTTSTTREFLLVCAAAGAPVAVIGVNVFFLKRLGIRGLPMLPNCLIFQVAVSSNSEKIFEDYVKDKMAKELNELFSDVEGLLRTELGDDFNKISPETLDVLKQIKISESRMCVEKEVQKAKEAVKEEKVPLPPPTNLSVKESHESSTSLLAFYDKPKDGEIDGYIVTAKSSDDKKVREFRSKDECALLDNLKPGQTYVIWVQSVKGEICSEKCFLRDSVKIALFGPRPSRDAPKSAVEDDGSDTKVGAEMTDLRIHLRNVFPLSTFSEKRMEALLSKFSDLGIEEARDLKYLWRGHLMRDGTLKPAEIEKLLEYAEEGKRSITMRERRRLDSFRRDELEELHRYRGMYPPWIY